MSWRAQYPGKCVVCPAPIAVDDLVDWANDDVHLRHATCTEKPVEPCTRCFLVPSEAGACGCD